MDPTHLTATEFQDAFEALSQKAKQEPVVITEQGRDSLVVLSADEWMRLRSRNRRVGLTMDLPPEWIEAVSAAEVPADYACLDAELT